jgi:hypothetical protein
MSRMRRVRNSKLTRRQDFRTSFPCGCVAWKVTIPLARRAVACGFHLPHAGRSIPP